MKTETPNLVGTRYGEQQVGLTSLKHSHRHIVFHPRMAWMMYFEETGNVREVCTLFGISRKTFYKWWARYRTSGRDPDSLRDRSRRPRNSPNATPANVIELVIEAKKETGFGQRKLREYLKKRYNFLLSEHTIWKLLKRYWAVRNGMSIGVVG